MDDYISRKAATEKLRTNLTYMQAFGADRSIMLINEVPSADVQPVRHGHWTLQEDRTKKLYGWLICSECGAFIGEPTNYCSNCGADMRGERNG